MDFGCRICFPNKNLINIDIVVPTIVKMMILAFLLLNLAKTEKFYYSNGEFIPSYCDRGHWAAWHVTRSVSTN